MKTHSPEIPRTLVIGGLVTIATLAVMVNVQRKRSLSTAEDKLFSVCESALRQLSLRVPSLVS